jgi:hypothetical protein
MLDNVIENVQKATTALAFIGAVRRLMIDDRTPEQRLADLELEYAAIKSNRIAEDNRYRPDTSYSTLFFYELGLANIVPDNVVERRRQEDELYRTTGDALRRARG